MGISNLLIKAERNYQAGEWAEKQTFYDIAVSRYYYCLYEKTIYIQKSKKYSISAPLGQLSHMTFINEMGRNLKDKLTEEEIACFACFNKLSEMRNTADYREELLVDSNAYKLSFKWSFNQINSILDRLIRLTRRN